MEQKDKERVVTVYVKNKYWDKVRCIAFHSNRSIKAVINEALETYLVKDKDEAHGEKA